VIISKQTYGLKFLAGMANVPNNDYINYDKREGSPQIIVNLDNYEDGTLAKRDNYQLVLPLQDCHSLYSDGTYLFCAARSALGGEALFRITPSLVATEVGRLNQIGEQLYYVNANGLLYISSKVWCGVYDYSTDSLRGWGLDYSDDISVINDLTNSDELMTLYNKAPRPMEFITLYSSRIVGARGSQLVYSQPFAYEWFRPENFIDFPEPLTMIAVDHNGGGLYVASYNTTWYLKPTSEGFPQSILSKIGDGAVPNTLQYGLTIGDKHNIPVWCGQSGLRAGFGDTEVRLTDNKLRMGFANVLGASLLRKLNGMQQYLVSAPYSSDAGFQDSATAEVFRRGYLVPPT
jgi:hypothetical protein